MHPNIVQLREVFLTEHHLAVAMEYADGGDLSEYIDQQYQRGVRQRLPPPYLPSLFRRSNRGFASTKPDCVWGPSGFQPTPSLHAL